MNALSWALYAADAFGSLKVVFALFAVALGPIFLIVTAIQHDSFECRFENSLAWPWPKKSVIAASILAILSCIVPSTKTVYLVAASEVAGRVADSPEGRQMLDLIRRRIFDALSDKA